MTVPVPVTSKSRVFCGIGAPGVVLECLCAAQKELKAILKESKITWPRLSEAHLTLAFLGEVDSSNITHISQALAPVCMKSKPVNLLLTGRGCFPGGRNPKVLWTGVEDDASGQLANLQGRIRQALGAYIERPDPRDFHPHVTLARIKHLASKEREALLKWLEAARAAPVPWLAASVKLYASHLSPEGAKHYVLAEHPLGCD
jgi:RNA 2',3'-cyclic 3'-phosphodiesterase